MLGLLFGRRQRKQKRHGRLGVLWVPVLSVKRLVVDGKELLVRRIIHMDDEEVVYEDVYGNIKTLKREKKKEEAKHKAMPLTVS